LQPTKWPENFKAIRRIRFTSIDDLIRVMKPQSEEGVPLIIEGSEVMDSVKWRDLSYLQGLLGEKAVLVKKSPNSKFRYFDAKKNVGKFAFTPPITESMQTARSFFSEAEEIMRQERPHRMYLQESLSGHAEMAEEFGSWRWELLVRVSKACGWGLPDSNELFVGMQGAETPLHFDERENLFFQVRGLKEIVVFPFVDYTRMYPFPTTHPCDRQSMVGSPINPDTEAFPKFSSSVGHFGTLKAGDLLYLPYGWWHWLRNLDHFAVSVSFWSTTPANDLSRGIPETFTDHMLTRVRRNLESMIAQQYGYENHSKTMLRLRQAVLEKRADEPVLVLVRSLLEAVRLPPEKQDAFLLEMIEGRFGIDWDKHVAG